MRQGARTGYPAVTLTPCSALPLHCPSGRVALAPDTAQGTGDPPAGQAGAKSPPIPPSHGGRAPNGSSEAGTHPGSQLDLGLLAQSESIFALSNRHTGLRGNLDE